MKLNSPYLENAMRTPGLKSKDPAALASKAQGQQDPEAIKEVAKQFESIFMHQVFKSMRQTLPKDGMMSGGFGEDVFTDMLDQEYADMAIQSRSMGLAETIAAQLGGPSSGLETALAPMALRQLKASQAYASKTTAGQWKAPVDTKTERAFGMHRAPTESMARFHDGIDFAGDAYATVQVARAGQVTSVKELAGGSYAVEINHGDGFVSSYEGVRGVLVREGENVEQGVELGKAGSSSSDHAEGLHFEIRHRGRSIDPAPLINE